MDNQRFSHPTLQISPLVEKELSRLQQLQNGKQVLPPWRTLWDIVRMITFRVESELQKWNQFIPEYHVPWMTQVLLKKWTTETDLRLDTVSQVYYANVSDMTIPISGIDAFDAVFSQIPDALIFQWFVKNLDQVCDVLEKLLRPAIEKKEDMLILSNHATWFNLPLIAHCLHRIFGIPKENIYTIIGPAITHSIFSLSGILRFSNAMKTAPDTLKAEIGYENIPKMRIEFLDAVMKLVKSENGTRFPRIFLLAPSGTTDENTGTNIIMAQPSKGTLTLVRLLLKKLKLKGFVVGVNDVDMIPSGHSRPKAFGGNAYVSWTRVDAGDWKEELPKHIVDKDGNPIGKWKDDSRSGIA